MSTDGVADRNIELVHFDRDGSAICTMNTATLMTKDLSGVSCGACSIIANRLLDLRKKSTPELCDHFGDYNIYTRAIGYANVRVYSCHKCGAQLAMDTLPQPLLKRMWGEPNKSVVTQSLVDVDFCVTFNGLNALLLSRIFFWSLKKTTSIGGVNFHLVNIDLSEEEFAEIVAMAPKCNTYQRPPSVDGYPGGDAVWSCEWVLENCGKKQFVVLSHFDTFFVRDFLTCLRRMVTQNTGMLGQHCPFMLLNREACTRTRAGFSYMGSLYAQPMPHQPNQCYIYHHGDPRINSNAMLSGFDVGEWLELEMRWLGYDCNPMRDRFDEHFYHFIGGSRVREGEEFISIQERARMFIEEYDIP